MIPDNAASGVKTEDDGTESIDIKEEANDE
jgi:hypothetical protein